MTHNFENGRIARAEKTKLATNRPGKGCLATTSGSIFTKILGGFWNLAVSFCSNSSVRSSIIILVLASTNLGCSTLFEADWSAPGSQSYSRKMDKISEDGWQKSRQYVAASKERFQRENPEFYKRLEKAVSDDTIIIERDFDGALLIGK